MTTTDETILKANGAMKPTVPAAIHGALILTPNRLKFESGWVHTPLLMGLYSRGVEIPVDTITDVRPEKWRSIWHVLALNVAVLWPGLLRSLGGNLAVETQSATHHFRVADPEEWVRALAQVGGGQP